MHSPTEKNNDHATVSRALLLWLALGYLTFVVYGSLVPLNFHGRPLAEAWLAFRDIRYLNLSIGSRADWVANILLFIPLAFLWSGVLWPTRGVIRRALVVLGVFAACMVLSLAIEFTQLFFPPRTVSLNDILAESIGAAVGVAAWIVSGPRLMAWLAGWRSVHSPLDVWSRVLYLYLFVLFAYNLLPLDLTLSPVEIFHKWREGRVVLVPFSFVFANPIEAVYALGVDALVWIPAAFLWCMAYPRGKLRPWLAVVAIATALEFLQLFVYTRVSDITDIFAAAIGAWLGAWLAGQMGPAATGSTARPLPHLAWLWLGLALMWMAVLAAVFWYPFNFQASGEFLAGRLHGVLKVPFEAYYYGTEYRAATEVLHKAGFFLPLGMLLALAVMRIRYIEWRRYAGAAALAVIGMTAFGIELGQLFVPGKNVDVTDWVLEVLGGGIGFSLIRYLNRRGAPAARETRTPVAQPLPIPAQGIAMCGRRLVSMIVAGVAIWAAIAWLVMHADSMPYNVRELVDAGHPLLSLVLLACALYWVIGFPVLIARWLARGELYLLILPPLVLVHGLVAWMLLRLAVPIESIHDIVGSPVLDWPWEWEMLGRFLAMFCFWSVAATAGGALAAWRILPGAKSALLGWLIGACLLIPLSYYIVVVAAATDNLVELVAGNGGVGAFLLIGVALTGVAFSGTSGALALMQDAKRRMQAAAWMLGAGVLAYLALYFGTEQVIVKYGQVFSALQFLLSSDRSHLAGAGELMVRYAVLYGLLIAAIMMVQYPLWRWALSVSPSKAKRIGARLSSSAAR